MAGEYSSLGPEDGFPVMADPALDDVFELVRTYQTELDYTPDANPKRVQEILEDLNENWPLTNKILEVSGIVKSTIIETSEDEDESSYEHGPGNVMVVPKRGEDDNVERIEIFVDEQRFVSKGFVAELKAWPELVGGYDIGYRAVLKLSLERLVVVHLSDDDSRKCIMDCDALVGQVSLKAPEDSPVLTEMKAREYFEDIIKQTDENIKPDMTPAEKLKALQQIDLTYPPYITGAELAVLENYLNEIIGLEYETMPFVISVAEGTALFDPDEPKRVIDLLKSQGFLVSVVGVRLFTKIDVAPSGEGVALAINPGELDARLALRFIAEYAWNDSCEVEVNMRDIEEIKNFRQVFYPEETEDDEIEPIDED